MGELFEMHIVTFGQRQYAHKIAEVVYILISSRVKLLPKSGDFELFLRV